ncbi:MULTISPECIES: hypothetical protein [Geomicrobium]|uniref:Uncharacterized protein n=1 Tax=Geomicrobium sediminis TaxID=1347788 RepID=A0ABS2P8Y6_9BACL|nr:MULTISPECIES: hypothetical protein [Geomicrobium]MBM7631540.1 hypothetical protein [Geomicrobium sediminis]GAK10129.1 hypothetical protein JCM19038_4013 [Geomicrobium sp. JCM 19038]
MLFRICMAILGISVATVGGVGMVAYLNLIVSGYSLHEFWDFIIRRPELYFLFGGLSLAFISLYRRNGRKKKKHEIVNHRSEHE